MQNGRLIFFREKTWQDAIRSHKIEIDGVESGVLKPKASLEVEVPAGSHTCQARISWTGSPLVEIEVKLGETTRIAVVPAKGKAITKLDGTTRWLELRPE
jgi:hypothetical protein